MQTVDKAMKLLNLFSIQKPEIGLSELSRMAGIDKAGTRRLLIALQKHAFVEQDLDTRDYRLGIGFIKLARIREANSPMVHIVDPILRNLTQITEEMAHASLSAGSDASMMSIGISPSTRVIRVHLEEDEPLPVHATASGNAYLAYSTSERFDELVSGELESHTSETLCDLDTFRAELLQVQKRGYASSNQTYDSEAFGIAAPFFDSLGHPMGAIAVASPVSRMNDEREAEIAKLVVNAALEITKAIGGYASEAFNRANKERLS